MDAGLEIFFFLHKAPRYVLLMPSLFAKKCIVEFYGKRYILNLICSRYHLTEQRMKGSVAYVHSLLISVLPPSPPKKCLQKDALKFPLFFCCLSHNCITKKKIC